jgi:2-keto-4-pentenoate hydratase/2-oxohepta-3-ene-1,7-dioic acid hydratase in catechol pathway
VNAATWSLVTVRADATEQAAVLRADGTTVALPEALAAPGVLALLERWDQVEPALRAFDPAAAPALTGATPLTPVRFPRKLICAGANYGDHLAEMKVGAVPDPLEPYFFLLPPSTTMIGSGEAIRIPQDPSWRVDWEAELAVVIGRGGRGIAAADARHHVAGYAPFNDISARGRHKRADPLAPPFTFDWLGSKGADTFCPMGPGVVPDFLIDDPHDLSVKCWRNGEVEQDGNTQNMINDAWRLIEAISAYVTLEPGDVLATGTPAGVGAPRGLQLAPGDEVVVEIEGLGRLVNPVVAID